MEPNQQTVQNNNSPVAETNNQPATNPTPAEDMAVQNEPKKKSSKTGIILGFVLLFLLAAGGIGFGVWAMMDGNTQKEQLNAKIDELKKQNNELEEMISVDSGDHAADSDTGRYIYVGEWGLKIKIPDELKKVSYELGYGDDNQSSLCISGVAGETNYLPEFADINKNRPGLGCVSRSTGVEPMMCTVVFSENDFDYCVSRANGPFSAGDELVLENNAINAIWETLNNKTNYIRL